MSGRRELHLDIVSDPRELCHVRDAVEQCVCTGEWTEQEIHDFVLAVDEALTNVIKHGYQNQPGRPIEVDIRSISDPKRGEGLEIVIRDYGRQPPLDSIQSRDLDDVRPGGLGVHIIRSIMHEARYEHAEGGGLRLVMRKFRGRPTVGGGEDDS